MSKLLYIIFIIQFYVISGQVFTTDRRYSPSPYSAEIKDSTELVVLYDISFATGSTKKVNSQAFLQIGSKFSKFLDANTLRRDSLLEKYSKLKSLGGSELNELGKLKIIYNNNILKDLLSKRIFYQGKVSKNSYQYDESFPAQNWILSNDNKIILGYHCKSAKLMFRGRNYVAWYTVEIPKNDGPANFSGLPGLILKISDDKGEYEFSAIAIEKRKMNIYWRNEKSIIPISRDDFRKIQRNYFENPGFFLSGKAYDANGKEIVPKLPSKPYNPMELK